jgi:hypothetical protein
MQHYGLDELDVGTLKSLHKEVQSELAKRSADLGVTQFQARAILLVDEWLGWAAMLYLHEAKSTAFWPCFAFFIACVYAVSYPLYWRRWDRWWS